MEGFIARLEKRAAAVGSLLCVGLDPRLDDLKSPTAAAARDFCLRLVKATAPYAAAFKPNAAFFEALGPDGWSALKVVIDAIGEASTGQGAGRIPVILDAKRGDIASTAEAYAESAFRRLGADAITLNPYLGKDSIEPFLRKSERGVFLLCKTSNAGATDLQDLLVLDPESRDSRTDADNVPRSSLLPLHLHVARLAQAWNTRNNIGLVVGATYPETLANVRAVAPDLWFLVPGVGAQGGDLESALRAGLRKDGTGLLINVSRGISEAPDPVKAAAEMRDRIAHIRTHTTLGGAPSAGPVPISLTSTLADALLDAGCVKFGDFTLKSGLKSPIYIDLRQVVTYPRLLGQIGSAYMVVLRNLRFDRIAGLPYAAIPIATAVSLEGGFPMIYPRKEAKAYGTKAEIEGEYHAGETVVVIDDLATTGGTKFEAIEKLTAAGLRVSDVVVLIDRQSGAREALAQAGYNLHAVLTITQMLDHWEAAGRVEQDRIKATREFLSK